MTTYALCGGGTAGHITPLIAVAEELESLDPQASFVVVGTKGGRESELLPSHLQDMFVVPKLPFPRRIGRYALLFPFRWIATVISALRQLRARRADVVVGFGGYTAAPVYLAAWLAKIPLVIHEANALPGMANKLGATLTNNVAVCFPGTPLPHAQVVGMPMRQSVRGASAVSVSEARKHFGLKARTPVLLVTGGSTGAQSLNRTIEAVASECVKAGWQVLHLRGKDNDAPHGLPDGFVSLGYTDRMDLALRAASLVVSRAGAATVSEIQLTGVPAVFIPYHVGNGEQEHNARATINAGAAVMVSNKDFTPEWVRTSLLPLMADKKKREEMATSMAQLARSDAAARVAQMARHATQKGF